MPNGRLGLPEVGSVVRARTDRVARQIGARRARVVRIDRAKAPVYGDTGELLEYREKVYAIVLKSDRGPLTYWGPQTFWDYFAPAKRDVHKFRGQGSLLAPVPVRVSEWLPIPCGNRNEISDKGVITSDEDLCCSS